MIAKFLFFSAAAYMAYRYIGSSNKKAKELNQGSPARGSVEILPPEPGVSNATESLKAPRKTPLISPAAEDLGQRY
jgi:hypothetical protein